MRASGTLGNSPVPAGGSTLLQRLQGVRRWCGGRSAAGEEPHGEDDGRALGQEVRDYRSTAHAGIPGGSVLRGGPVDIHTGLIAVRRPIQADNYGESGGVRLPLARSSRRPKMWPAARDGQRPPGSRPRPRPPRRTLSSRWGQSAWSGPRRTDTRRRHPSCAGKRWQPPG